jgi:hypothetical protein
VKALVLSVVLLFPPTLAAQAAQVAPATFIDWGRVSSSIYSDPVMGVQLWIGTSLRASGTDDRSVSTKLAPDSVLSWADAAAVVIDPRTPPADPARVLATPPLSTLDHGVLRLLRRADGTAWEDRVILSVEPGDSARPLNVAARPEEARAFLRALYQHAIDSRLAPDWETTAKAKYRTNCATDSVVMAPSILSSGEMTYPATAPAAGRVLLEFVIRADGAVEPGSIVALAATDPVFVAPSQRLVLGSRFSPATCRGVPIAIVVRQSVNYAR